jgi:hypothetical protein
MTQTQDTGRPTLVVPINGRSIVIRKLTDAQMMHVLRYARIMQRDGVAIPAKLDAVERLMNILHMMVVQESDLDFLVEAEEKGKVELSDLMSFLSKFNDEDADEEKPKVRRGRPPAKRL